MSKRLILCIGLIIATTTSGIFGRETWTNLKVTFGYNPMTSFDPLPRTARTAENNGWKIITNKDCTNGGKFFGYRYIKGKDVTLALLFDKNGIIAGIQMNLLKEEILKSGNNYQYDSVPMFQPDTINNQSVYILTAYFVAPLSICTIGRSNRNLEKQGTGTMLKFQNGSTPTDTIDVPEIRSEAIAAGWSKNNCFYGMGYHNFYKIEEAHISNCTEMLPAFLLYSKNNELLGFGLSSPGYATSSRFEHPPSSVLKTIIGKHTPKCILDIADTVKFSSIHVYFIDRPYLVNCWSSWF